MDYFAGLDISMDETHVCVLDREGVVVYESKSESTAAAIADQGVRKLRVVVGIVFETGRMAPILFHGLSQLSLPVVCVGEPTGLPGAQGARVQKDRSQRCAGAGAFGSHWLLQARAREIAASSCAPLTDQRAQEAGRPTGDLGEPDPWSCGRVRGPTSPGARLRLHRQRS